jgi:hypothetical protein
MLRVYPRTKELVPEYDHQDEEIQEGQRAADDMDGKQFVVHDRTKTASGELGQ